MHSGTEPLLTTHEAAAILQVSPSTLRAWVRAGRITPIRHGWEYRFERSALTRTEEPSKWHSTDVKIRRSGGRVSVFRGTPDFDSQLTQLIVERRKPSTTGSAVSSSRSQHKLLVELA